MEAAPTGWMMTAFSCSACGGHAFKLSVDLKQAHCADCEKALGSWQTLRAAIKQNLRPMPLSASALAEGAERPSA